MIVKHFPENNDVKIVPIADVHLGSLGHQEKEWDKFIKALYDEPNTYIALVGDLLENATKNSVGSVFSQKLRPSEQKKIMAEYLKPLKDRILCTVTGNHEARSQKDADDEPTYDIMCKLDIEDIYREEMAIVKLQMGDIKGNGTKNPTYVLGIHHGSGSGAKTGSAVNRAEGFVYHFEGMDGFITGHSHKMFNTAPAKIVIDKHNNKVTRRPINIISCVSWMDYIGYPVKYQLQPASTGEDVSQEIILSGNKKRIEVKNITSW